jgi:hypothetical protein
MPAALGDLRPSRGQEKIGSASALSVFPLNSHGSARQLRQHLGISGLPGGQKKFDSAYALSGFPLNSHGSATPPRRHLGAVPPTAPVGHMVGCPLGGRLGHALVVGTPLGGPPDLFARVAHLVGLPLGSNVGILIGRQHLGAARAVGFLLGGPAGVILGVPLLGMPVGFGLGSLVEFDVVADGRSGRQC